ncbi:MAG: serine/threonine-protein kinase [Candidatus Obscuribacterales bacterium]|nr:serine/threonine-protein kinase [Candidatus Obscuribacterales bacterium]
MKENHASQYEMPEDPQRLIGVLLDSQYKIQELIGRGAMSLVFKARYSMLDRDVVVKVLPARMVSDRTNLLNFKRIAQSTSALEHPNIAKIYGFGTTGGEQSSPYLVIDYLSGPTLAQTLKERKKLPVKQTLKLFAELCNALAYAHDKGIYHGNLKPSNIILPAIDQASGSKILDFGMGRLGELDGESIKSALRSGTTTLDPAYVSPELCAGRTVDKNSDIYSIGCMLYETLSGQHPYGKGSAEEMLKKHGTSAPLPLIIEGVDKNLVDALDAVVFKALKKDPEKRYQTMTDFSQALMELETLTSAEALPGSVSAKFASRQERLLYRLYYGLRKTFLYIILALFLFAAGGAFIWSKIAWFYTTHEFTSANFVWQTEVSKQADQALLAKKWQRVNELNRSGQMNSMNYALACEELGEALFAAGEVTNSISWFEQAVLVRGICKKPSEDLYLKLGNATKISGRYSDARRAYTQACRYYEAEKSGNQFNHALCLVNLGDIYRYEKNWSEAEKNYAEAAKLTEGEAAPEFLSFKQKIALCRAFVMQMQEQYGQAAQLYKQAWPLLEKEQAVRPALEGYAYSLWRNNDYLSAVLMYERAKTTK